MIFFTADTRFGTNNVSIPVVRPWINSEDMDRESIKRWNYKVGPDDTVFHLGDFSMKQDYTTVKSYLSQLNGRIILISGNHDEKFSRKTEKLFYKFYKHQYELLATKFELYVMNHCPMFEWNKSHHNSFHLFGHCYGVVKVQGKTWDVDVDNNNYELLSLDDIRDIMKDRPDNNNYRGRTKPFNYSYFYQKFLDNSNYIC